MKFALKTTALILVIIFIVLIVRAPASAVRRFIPPDSPVTLTNLEGTLWNGSAQIFLNAEDVGLAKWVWRSGDLTELMVGYDWSLTRDGLSLNGVLASNGNEASVTATGLVADHIINSYLQPYDLTISGDLSLENVQAEVVDRQLNSIEGLLTWEGGATRYQLASRHYQAIVPPLVGTLGLIDNHPALTVIREGGEITLIRAELLPTGYAKLGITKRFTQLLGNPWPGRDPDHKVVLEVEEQIFLQ